MAKKKVNKIKSRAPWMAALFVLIGAIIMGGYYISYSSNSSMIANPASVKCVNDGGQEKIVTEALGQAGLCMFNDGTVCDEWAYFRGECKKGDCLRKCDLIGTRSEGWYDCNGKLLFYDNCAGENPATAGTC
jgi:putative hemolysin